MFLKLILFALIIYWGSKLLKSLFLPQSPQNKTKQQQTKTKPEPVNKNKPLDLSQYDIEDAKFEDLDD